jgi:hypothetical protein
MEVGDLVKQKTFGANIISKFLRSSLNMDLIGIIIEIHDKRLYSYDGNSPGDITVRWSNGRTETLPEIYLERVQNG